MTDTNHPPRVADWLLFLFVSKDQAPPILGDLREEFSAVASRRGLWSARLWYWRQVAKTVPHLFYAQLVLEPWQVFTAVVAGLVLLTLAYMPLYVVQPFRVLARYYPAHSSESLQYAWQVLWLGVFPIVLYILPSILVGWIVARASKARDMVVTIVFSCTTFLLGMIPFLILFFHVSYVHVVPSPSPVWRLFWVTHLYEGPIAAPIGTFIGGMTARKMAHASAKPAR